MSLETNANALADMVGEEWICCGAPRAGAHAPSCEAALARLVLVDGGGPMVVARPTRRRATLLDALLLELAVAEDRAATLVDLSRRFPEHAEELRAALRELESELTDEAEHDDGAVDLDALSPAVQRAVAAFREELGS